MDEAACDKVRYESHKEASSMIAGLQKRQGRRHKFSVYKCERCGGFHITTTTKRTLRKTDKMNKYPLRLEDYTKKPENLKKTRKRKRR